MLVFDMNKNLSELLDGIVIGKIFHRVILAIEVRIVHKDEYLTVCYHLGQT